MHSLHDDGLDGAVVRLSTLTGSVSIDCFGASLNLSEDSCEVVQPWSRMFTFGPRNFLPQHQQMRRRLDRVAISISCEFAESEFAANSSTKFRKRLGEFRRA